MVKKTGDSGEILRCSFCNKSHRDVRKLIAGPTVFICDECVEVCNDIIAHDARLEQTGGKEPEPAGLPKLTSLARTWCALCRLPVAAEEALAVENRAPCVG